MGAKRRSGWGAFANFRERSRHENLLAPPGEMGGSQATAPRLLGLESRRRGESKLRGMPDETPPRDVLSGRGGGRPLGADSGPLQSMVVRAPVLLRLRPSRLRTEDQKSDIASRISIEPLQIAHRSHEGLARNRAEPRTNEDLLPKPLGRGQHPRNAALCYSVPHAFPVHAADFGWCWPQVLLHQRKSTFCFRLNTMLTFSTH